MKRRGFITTALAALLAPRAVKAVAPRGWVIWEPGVVYAPWVPLELEIVSTPVTATVRKLRASWPCPAYLAPELQECEQELIGGIRALDHPVDAPYDPS